MPLRFTPDLGLMSGRPHNPQSRWGRWSSFTNRPRGPEVGGARPASWLSAPASPALGRQEAVVAFARATRGDAAAPRIEDRRSLQNLRKKEVRTAQIALAVPLPPEVTTSSGSLDANPAGPAEQGKLSKPLKAQAHVLWACALMTPLLTTKPLGRRFSSVGRATDL